MPLRPLLACSALLVAAHCGFAQVKIAVVNSQLALLGTAEVKKADAQMQATFKPRADEIEQLKKELEALSNQIQSGKLTPQQEADVTSLGKRKQTDLQRKQDDLQADAQAFRDEVLQKSGSKMQAVVKKLAEEKGYDLVVEAGTTLFFKPALDITNEAIAAYDKANPVAAAPPPAGK
jgi:outer membrane protein